MIQIHKESTNTIALTLTEAVTLESPVFLFEFKNDQDKEAKYFIAEDISIFKDRYNKFLIIEKTNPDPMLGEVELVLTGFWSYKIYEQISNTNLDPALCDNITPLEVGKVKVIGEVIAQSIYDFDQNIKVYNG